jgi:serine protease Do
MTLSTNSISQPTTIRKRHNGRLLRRSALAVAVALTVALTVVGMTAVAKNTPALPDTSPWVIEQSAVQAPPSFATLVERVQPAVVNVTVTKTSVSTSASDLPGLELPNDPNLKEFFGRFFRQSPPLPDRRGATPEVQGVGSGFIVTADGYVVTSNHVIEDATEIQVVLNDGKRLPAEVRGRDPKSDLALLKIETDHKLPYAIFGDSDGARPGDWVVAIGNPFGLGGTVTTGIISARGRDIQSGPYDDFLQIDAPINRGNSGGPLFDTSGRVIGVNTAIFSPTGGNVGIGFAVPAAQAKSVIQQLMAKGHVERGWLGVQIQTLTESLAKSMKLLRTHGALVTRVTPDSPAARAGIEVGDVILTFNDHEVTEMKELPKLVADAAPGQKTRLTVWRQGKKQNLEVSIAGFPEVTANVTEVATKAVAGTRLGVALAPMTDELRQRFEVPMDVEGALVLEVESGSLAEREGIRPGDVIVQAGGKPVSKPADVVSIVRPAERSCPAIFPDVYRWIGRVTTSMNWPLISTRCWTVSHL